MAKLLIARRPCITAVSDYDFAEAHANDETIRIGSEQ